MTAHIEVIEIESSEIIRTIDVSGLSPRRVEKVERGLLMAMDLERYTTNVVGVEFPEPDYSDVFGLE
jgi:hypothetical protein